jgi:hypothetical protein
MPHKKIAHHRSVRYEVKILCNIGFFGTFTADTPIVTCYTGTVSIQHAKALEKSLTKGVKECLTGFNEKFKIGSLRLHFNCKIEESSGRPQRIPRKVVDRQIIIDKVVATVMKKIHTKMMDFFISSEKNFNGIAVTMAKIIKDENSPMVIDTRKTVKHS